MFFNEKKHIDDERRLVLSGEETYLEAGALAAVLRAAAAFNDRKKINAGLSFIVFGLSLPPLPGRKAF